MINNKIIQIASNTKFFGLTNNFSHSAVKKNKKCGDSIKIEILLKKNNFITMRYETESCIFCQASASFLANEIKKFTKKNLNQEIIYIKDSIIYENRFLPNKFKAFKDVANNSNISRIDCIMLPFNALLKALKP